MKYFIIMFWFLPFLSIILSVHGEENLDPNPLVGDGIDAEEAKALRQSPFKLAISNSKTQGSITGVVEATELDNVFYSFRGIRYASAERWKDPKVLLDDWTQLPNAQDGPACPQEPKEGYIISEENCLWLNVFTPELSELENPSLEAKYDVANGFLHEHKFSKHAVIVFLHPAGPHWDKGWAADEDYGPLHLLDYETLLVTVNYRIGEFGFGNGKNLGLKDQNAALKWVNKNIDRFGGDANRVTIIGHGSGGAAAHFHLLSPMSAGLFKSAISMSGSALNPWAFVPSSEWENGKGRIGPTVDGEFLTGNPEELIKSGRFQKDCQWIAGVVSEEGKLLATQTNMNGLESFLKSFGFKSSDFKDISNAYIKNKLGKVEDLISDVLYNIGMDRSMRLMAENSNRGIYAYKLHQPNITIPDIPLSHGDELPYLFPMTLADPLQKDDEDQVFRNILLRMFSDFVRFGHPTANTWNRQHLHHSYWRHFKLNKPEYLDLKMNNIKMKEGMFRDRLEFWRKHLEEPKIKNEL
ncbi:carboxylic ester hydrolase [Lepeophtheirus salmonis]|uniref:CG4382 CG4382PAlike [Tribolium castaneum] n=1 Tax=Lepeophtheirus salmonis TaxID=72036 RepID=A0A0K2T105_LEPSM|nr:esterase E4-like [Lepeophtheirus salmonis]